MKYMLHAVLAMLAGTFFASAAAQHTDIPPPVGLTTEEDHARAMRLLGIDYLRPGANGMDTTAANYANYDESQANPYPHLPDPLLTNERRPVATEQMWWEIRRPEIVEFFDREIYGRVPENLPDVHWDVVSRTDTTIGGVSAVMRRLVGRVDNTSYPHVNVHMDALVTAPTAGQKAVPAVMQLGFIVNPWARFFPRPEGGPTWKEQVLQKGWGYAILEPNSIQEDHGEGLTRGIIGLGNRGQPRDLDDWGALRAWAWGAGRLLDFLETDSTIDAERVAIQGHSRYGKAAAVAMAFDQRFAAAFVSSSGEGGLKLHRRNWGEIVENLAGSGEYHWMAANFIKYGGPFTWDDLPVDSHQLLALCAPRPVFISSGDVGDYWVDARGMFMAGVHAGPVYELLGARGLGTDEFPGADIALTSGEIAFRQHSGGHTPGPNWPTFVSFAQPYLEPQRSE